MEYDVGNQSTSELLSVLSQNKYLEPIPNLSTLNDYCTFDHLKSNVEQMVISFGGRLSINEVQALADIDMAFVNRVIQQICSDKPEDFQIIGGDIVHKMYFSELAEEIHDLVQLEGSTSIGNLSLRFQLPLDQVTAIVRTHLLDTDCSDTVLKSSTLFSRQHLLEQEGILRGTCGAATKPVRLSQLAGVVTGMDEASVLNYLSKLCKDGKDPADHASTGMALCGHVTSKEFVPHVFKDKQRRLVDAYFKTNGLIELSTLTRFQVVTKPLEYIQVSFPDAILLDSCIISENISSLFLAEVRELATVQPSDDENASGKDTKAVSWDGSGGIPWLCLADSLPPALGEEDVSQMWKRLLSGSSTGSLDNLSAQERSSVLLIEASDGLYLFNKAYTAWLLHVFEGDAQTMGEVVTAELKAKVAKAALSIASNASVSASAVGVSAEEDWEEDGGGKGKKKGGKFVKGKKASSKSMKSASNKSDVLAGVGRDGSSASVKDVRVEVLIAPYVAEERLLRLVREACADLLQFASPGAEDEAGEDGLNPMLEALLENMREDILIPYKAAAARAKEDASQGGITSRMKKEEERDRKFDVMHSELYVVCKGLAVLEDRKVDDAPDISRAGTAALHRELLSTRCARIAELLTAFACWENGLTLECQDGAAAFNEHSEAAASSSTPSDSFDSTKIRPVLSMEERNRILAVLPKETAKAVKNMWTLVTAGRQSVWDFLDFLETCSSSGQLQLVCHKPDKKKEKAIAFSMKQTLMDRLRPSQDAAASLPVVLSMCVLQCSGCMLEICDEDLLTTYTDALAYIMAYLQLHLAPTDFALVDALKRFVTGEELPESGAEVSDESRESIILEAAKGIVLKSK